MNCRCYYKYRGGGVPPFRAFSFLVLQHLFAWVNKDRLGLGGELSSEIRSFSPNVCSTFHHSVVETLLNPFISAPTLGYLLTVQQCPPTPTELPKLWSSVGVLCILSPFISGLTWVDWSKPDFGYIVVSIQVMSAQGFLFGRKESFLYEWLKQSLISISITSVSESSAQSTMHFSNVMACLCLPSLLL